MNIHCTMWIVAFLQHKPLLKSSVLHPYVGCLVQWPHCNHTTLALCWKKTEESFQNCRKTKG